MEYPNIVIKEFDGVNAIIGLSVFCIILKILIDKKIVKTTEQRELCKTIQIIYQTIIFWELIEVLQSVERLMTIIGLSIICLLLKILHNIKIIKVFPDVLYRSIKYIMGWEVAGIIIHLFSQC